MDNDKRARLLRARKVLITHWWNSTYPKHVIVPTINRLYQMIYLEV